LGIRFLPILSVHMQFKMEWVKSFKMNGAPGRIRIPNLLIRSQFFNTLMKIYDFKLCLTTLNIPSIYKECSLYDDLQRFIDFAEIGSNRVATDAI